jgi:hypothetical protein
VKRNNRVCSFSGKSRPRNYHSLQQRMMPNSKFALQYQWIAALLGVLGSCACRGAAHGLNSVRPGFLPREDASARLRHGALVPVRRNRLELGAFWSRRPDHI